MIQISVKTLPNLGDLPLPSYATVDSAGMDLLAAIDQDITLRPFERKVIPCGIAIALPEGFEAQVRARSGLALKHGIIVPNAPGTIDADYRGEVGALLMNVSDSEFVITRGMRVAQMVINQYARSNWNIVDTLEETSRGDGGFGSTGIHSKKVA